MEKRKTWKYCLILLFVLLAAGVVLQPLYAAENQCGIWCPGCAKWQENFESKVTGSEKNSEIIISCAECERELISVSRWVETAHYNVGTEDESSSWWRYYTVERLDEAVTFPEAMTEMEGDSASKENTYRVTADGDVFGTTGYGWTTEEIFNEAEACLEALYISLDAFVKDSEDGAFTWEKWYQYGLSIAQTGEKASPLITYLGKFGIQAMLQEEMVPPVLSVAGDAEVKLYRDGTLITEPVKAGDQVEIIPVKRQGREYAEYVLEGTVDDIVWDEATGKLCFTMPAKDVSIELFYLEVQRLDVELNAVFYETYQKEPYWDGVSFNLDCQPPITVEKEMLTVKAVLTHTGTGKEEARIQTEFSIEGDNRIVNLGENAITVKADVLGDGYELQGKCILKADSVSLKELMESTGSETYTELKAFVMGLTDKLAECERMIEELSQNLALSEEKRAEAERLLSEALAELENVNARLELSKEQLAAMSEELADKSEQLALSKEQLALTEERLAAASGELAGMKEKLTAMQEFMQEMTGSEQIDGETLGKLKEKFEELSQQKESLSDELDKVKEESGELATKNDELTTQNNELATQNGELSTQNNELVTQNGKLTAQNGELATQNGELSKEKEELVRDIERLRNSNDEFAEQLKYTLEEQKVLLGEYELLKGKYDTLVGEYAGKEQEYLQKLKQLEEKLTQIETEKEKLTAQLTEVNAQLTEANAQLKTEQEHAAALEAEVKQAQQIRQEQEIKQERESATVIRLETVTEMQTEKTMEIVTVAPTTVEETMTAPETVTAVETVTKSEIMPGTMTETPASTEQQSTKTSGLSLSIGAGRSILPGIVIVILAMFLGGLVLYVTLEQKEKKVLI